jgi:hypothetical protein
MNLFAKQKQKFDFALYVATDSFPSAHIIDVIILQGGFV